MTEAVELQHTRSEARLWKSRLSYGDIAEYLERTLKDNENLARKLAELLEENDRLKKSPTTLNGRHEAELAVRERLLKDEFERKTQEIRLEIKKEHRQLTLHVEKLKEELAGCFCRQLPGERVELRDKRPVPTSLRNPKRR
jgi:hypothetical protein